MSLISERKYCMFAYLLKCLLALMLVQNMSNACMLTNFAFLHVQYFYVYDCHDCLAMIVSLLSCPSCPAPGVLLQQSCSSSPAPVLLPQFSSPRCPVIAVMFWPSCRLCPVHDLSVLICQAELSRLTCPGCSVPDMF
jgi:hypothetical protein